MKLRVNANANIKNKIKNLPNLLFLIIIILSTKKNQKETAKRVKLTLQDTV